MQLSLWTPLLLVLGLAARARAIDCYTAYRMRNFTEIGIPAGTFFPTLDLEQFPSSGQPLYYRSCITYSVYGAYNLSFISFPEYSEEIEMMASGIDGQGASEPCSELIIGGQPTAAFLNYIWATPVVGEPANPNAPTYACCSTDLCNSGLGLVAYVNSAPRVLANAALLIASLSAVLLMLI